MTKTASATPAATPIGICVYCTDPRDHLWKRTKAQIIPPDEWYVPIGVLGGPICLAYPKDLPIEFNFLLAQIHFALGTFPTAQGRILIIGHDCGYYSKLQSGSPRRHFSLADKRRDLIIAANMLHRHFSRTRVMGYFKEPRTPGFTQMF
jgi:hypothetical protein